MANTEIMKWYDNDPDAQLAARLQEQFNHEARVENPSGNLVYDSKKEHNSSKSLIDPSWELVDPTPDVHNLFIVFNSQFFWGKLGAVSVNWSKRMTSCAGICSYNGRGGMCVITLSEPLLKLRPRKDLVETLLHEMIHALLFVTHNNKDRDGHGPEFHKHMYRINAEAGTKITVYHSFHDEVRLYQQHWWKCNGPCQYRKPYQGLVKRATNRAPGPNDFWWAEHSTSCGGTFTKIKEPEKPEKKSKSQKENKKPIEPNKNASDIRNFLPGASTSKSVSTSNNNTHNEVSKNKTISSHSSTIVIDYKTKPTSTIYNGKNDINGFHNINDLVISNPIKTFIGTGNLLTVSPVKTNSYETAREVWLKKFNNSTFAKSVKRRSTDLDLSAAKKICVHDEELKENKIMVKCPVCGSSIEDNKLNDHLDTCLVTETEQCFVCDKPVPKEDFQRHVNECLDSNDFNELNQTQEKIREKCDVCGINKVWKDFNLHLAECAIRLCRNIQGMANMPFDNNATETIFLDDDEAQSFINDNSLIEEYTSNSSANDD